MNYTVAQLLTLSLSYPHCRWIQGRQNVEVLHKSHTAEYYTQPTPGQAVCNTCKDVVKIGGTMAKSANTSNLWSHLRIHHNDLYKSAQTNKPEQGATSTCQPTIHDMFQKQKKWTNLNEKSKQMDKLITEIIISDNQPFTMVSDAGFKRLMDVAEPRYAIKSEKYYRTEKLPEIYERVGSKIKTLIQPENAGFSLSFTTDSWSGSTESMMSLTCHFIDNEWNRRQVVLNTKQCTDPIQGNTSKTHSCTCWRNGKLPKSV